MLLAVILGDQMRPAPWTVIRPDLHLTGGRASHSKCIAYPNYTRHPKKTALVEMQEVINNSHSFGSVPFGLKQASLRQHVLSVDTGDRQVNEAHL